MLPCCFPCYFYLSVFLFVFATMTWKNTVGISTMGSFSHLGWGASGFTVNSCSWKQHVEAAKDSLRFREKIEIYGGPSTLTTISCHEVTASLPGAIHTVYSSNGLNHWAGLCFSTIPTGGENQVTAHHHKQPIGKTPWKSTSPNFPLLDCSLCILFNPIWQQNETLRNSQPF